MTVWYNYHVENEVLRLHSSGLSNRQIAVSLGLKHHCKVGEILKNNNLKPNGSVRKQKLSIDGDEGLCTKCFRWVPLTQFRVNRKGRDDEYRLTFCNKCGWKQRNRYLNANLDAYLKDRFNTLKQHAKRRGWEFNLTLEQIETLFTKQGGLCAYTGEQMTMKKGRGLIDETMSFDRFDSSKGYVAGNVLLCTKQSNVAKSNLPLDKFKLWMPMLYKNGTEALKIWNEF